MITQTIIKIVITMILIIIASELSKRYPTFGGLIATMPLTTLMVLVWLSIDGKENDVLMNYCKGAVWGILPSLLFFITAYFAFKNQLSFKMVLVWSFSVWFIGAVVHTVLFSVFKL
jgi:uncharacterized membrane protein (GlpM family)